jgi:hypothetical protein
MVAHVWAQQKQAEGRGSNFYFRDATIYSYGVHFPIARFVTNDKGARAVLFTTRTYGMSTAKHLNYTRDALHGLDVPVFHVAHNELNRHADNRAAFEATAAKLYSKAARARSNAAWLQNECAATINHANRYAEFFGLAWNLAAPEFTPAAMERARRLDYDSKAAKREETAARKAAYAAALVLACDAWRTFSRPPEGVYVNIGDAPTMLRVTADGQTVQTSRGAEAPLQHVRPALEFWRRSVRDSLTYNRAGCAAIGGKAIELGMFTLDAINADGSIRAGCHEISRAEVERLAAALGVA